MEHNIVRHVHSVKLDNGTVNSAAINSATINSATSKSAL